MKLINPSWEIIEQKPGLEGIYEQIELAGRTCYKSTRKEGTTAKDFVDRMINSKHFSMLEHGAVYLKIPIYYPDEWNQNNKDKIVNKVANSPYSKIIRDSSNNFWYLSTNLRVIKENNAEFLLEYWCEPTKFHEKRVTVRFTTNIGVSREFNRHRVNSVAEQSTRYCNYAKDKFNNEISVVLPEELSDPELEPWLENYDEGRLKELAEELLNDNMNWGVLQSWLFANLACEYSYMNLIRLGWKPQQARRVLPLDLTTELVHTAFVSDWQHFFNLRTSTIAETGKPHPDAAVLADSLYKEFIKRKYLNEKF